MWKEMLSFRFSLYTKHDTKSGIRGSKSFRKLPIDVYLLHAGNLVKSYLYQLTFFFICDWRAFIILD